MGEGNNHPQVMCHLWKKRWEHLSSCFSWLTLSSHCVLWFLPPLPHGLDDKESACNEGDLVSIPGLGRSPGEGNGYSLQYSCQKNSMDRGAWWAIVHGVTRSQMWLVTNTLLHTGSPIIVLSFFSSNTKSPLVFKPYYPITPETS